MKNNKIIVVVLIILIVWLGTLTYFHVKKPETENTSGKNEYNVTGYSTDLTRVVDANKASMVAVEQNGLVSSGFIYAKKDNMMYVATTLHGVSESENVDLYLNSGAKMKGTVVGKDVYLDLALVECECPFEVVPLELSDSSLTKAGEFVVGIGTCGSLNYSFSSQFGMISSPYREVECNVTYEDEDYDYYLGVIQLSGEFNNGYSGTPILNMNGQGIGMITTKENDVTLASTINEVKIVLNKMMANEEYHRLNIGITGKYISDLENYETANLNIGLDVVNGYYISTVKTGSLANSVGITKGDVITNINGKEIVDENSMFDVIYSNQPEYVFSVIRNGEELSLVATIND